MRITAVKPRRKGLSGLYLDEEFVMNLDTKTLLENRFDVGREIDDEELKDVIKQSNARRAKEKALWLLTYRAHSKKELEDKLRRTCDADAAETAVTRMEELGLSNAGAYAESCARRLLLDKKMTRRAALYELTRKGIDKETAEAVLEEIDVDYRENIRSIIEKKYRDIRDEKVRRRAVAALQRLGYGWEDIKAVLETYDTQDET